MSGAAQRFDYHRSVAPMMWVLLVLSGIELLVVHVLIGLWSPGVAILVSLLTLSGMIWFAALIASFRKLPIILDEETLTMRVGHLRSFDIPLAAIRGLRGDWGADDLKRRDVSNLALLAYPNIWVDLDEPVSGRRGPIVAIAHKLDDPHAFTMALQDTLRPKAAPRLRGGSRV